MSPKNEEAWIRAKVLDREATAEKEDNKPADAQKNWEDAVAICDKTLPDNVAQTDSTHISLLLQRAHCNIELGIVLGGQSEAQDKANVAAAQAKSLAALDVAIRDADHVAEITCARETVARALNLAAKARLERGSIKKEPKDVDDALEKVGKAIAIVPRRSWLNELQTTRADCYEQKMIDALQDPPPVSLQLLDKLTDAIDWKAKCIWSHWQAHRGNPDHDAATRQVRLKTLLEKRLSCIDNLKTQPPIQDPLKASLNTAVKGDQQLITDIGTDAPDLQEALKNDLQELQKR
jgi:hypothetical protein